ncbi:DarT1-associated NADAR antitoxin family protein [Heyndrickxia sporothermodurans]|uniref:DarT1-associated NADAR antitoxin family protein n=1 Tax=Heyndrickxia sporothermodurans TaxID=46224 RepID=UPI000D36EB39|nr:hypothetical protein [Heyndrickxia sporothermodurans]PTY92934.1 hypothetical protein B5V90_02315 [Heyndrickxia sporothermodurans]
MSTLECSSKGDKRFSAFFARVDILGKTASIEEHYQHSKLFSVEDHHGNVSLESFTDIKHIKQKQRFGDLPVRFRVGDYDYPAEYLSMYYKLLWLTYLDAKPHLVRYASKFDNFTDMFRGKNTINCQADVIRQYVKEGRESILDECEPFINILSRDLEE